MTDRASGLARLRLGGNVRRLMYQTLIWRLVLRNHPRRLRTALDTEDCERLAHALVDGVRRDAELGGDLLRIQMPVDEAKAIELAVAELRDACRHRILGRRSMPRRIPIRVRQAVRFVQGNPHLAQHGALPSSESRETLGHPRRIRQIFSGFPPKWVNLG
nr:hypothetical protein [Sphingomonas segetis]